MDAVRSVGKTSCRGRQLGSETPVSPCASLWVQDKAPSLCSTSLVGQRDSVVALRGQTREGACPALRAVVPLGVGHGSRGPSEPVTALSVMGSRYSSPLRVWLPTVTQAMGVADRRGSVPEPSGPVRTPAPGFLQMPTPVPDKFLEASDSPSEFRRWPAFQKTQWNSSSHQESIQTLQSTLSFLA